jgi:hypothetical protein
MIRSSKNLYSGLMFVAFGAAGLYFGRGLTVGTAQNMGAGYFPQMISWGLLLMGVTLSVGAFLVDGERVGAIKLRPLAAVLAAVVLFALLARPFGLVVAVMAMTVVSTLGSDRPRILETLILALVLAIAASAIFIYGVGLPLKVWPL